MPHTHADSEGLQGCSTLYIETVKQHRSPI
jgi:hypothetical protein